MTRLVPLAAQGALAADDLAGDCRIGTYHLRDGTDVDIGATDGQHLSWRRKDGTTGVLTEANDGSWASREGYERLNAVRAKYADEPWFKHIHWNITFFLLQTPEAELRERGCAISFAPAE